jgi:hypothetical protein
MAARDFRDRFMVLRWKGNGDERMAIDVRDPW